MKLMLFILNIAAFTLSAYAEEYKAPDLKLKNIDKKKMSPVVNSGNWESGLNYKVEDKASNERAVASDEENIVKTMPSRDPSSKGQSKVAKDGEVQIWKFEDIEQHP
jgi:hypothetical protein